MQSERESNLAARENGEIMERPSAVANAMAASAMAEIRLAMQMAIDRPRNEDHAIGKVMKVCKRHAFAEKGVYRFPRGDKEIVGASIKLAEEMAKAWANLRWGFTVVMDEGVKRTVRGWAWDLENNSKKEVDLTFDKLIYRKRGGWIEPDERDLLELTNRNASKATRNAILSLLPWDMVQDAIAECKRTILDGIKKDPDAARKSMIAAFQLDLGISAAELTAFIGHPMEQLRPEKIAELRGIYSAIKGQETTWQDVVGKAAVTAGLEGAAPGTAAELRQRVREKANAPPPDAGPPPAGEPGGTKKGK
jgi:hypothetical protein